VRFGSFFIPAAVKSGRYIEILGKDEQDLYVLGGLTPPPMTPPRKGRSNR
jgi:hypothetical protein